MKNQRLRKIVITISVLTPFVINSCQITPRYNPFRLQSQKLFSRLNTLAVLPVILPKGIKKSDKVAERYEYLIRKALKNINIKTVPSNEYKKLLNAHKKKVGGFFDPMSGKADSEKIEGAHNLIMKKMKDSYPFEGILSISVSVVQASWSGNGAAWHGVKESTTGREGCLSGAPDAFGTMPALSLVVSIYDLEDNLYYMNYGGIQLLTRVIGKQFYDIPNDDLFIDKTRDIRAVNIALEPLFKEKTKNRIYQ